jgi:hypothetical protein
MTIAANTIPKAKLSDPYSTARQARKLRSAGRFGPAAELEVQLYWDSRCTRCGHPLTKPGTIEAGAGRDCAHGYLKST